MLLAVFPSQRNSARESERISLLAGAGGALTLQGAWRSLGAWHSLAYLLSLPGFSLGPLQQLLISSHHFVPFAVLSASRLGTHTWLLILIAGNTPAIEGLPWVNRGAV